MKTHHLKICSIVGYAVTLASTASAQVVSTETITAALNPTQPTFDARFPNVFDPIHPKLLTFEGTALVEKVGTDPTSLELKFDWVELGGGVVWSDPFSFDLSDSGSHPIAAKFLIPFCPQEVSIHFEVIGGNAYVNINGTFTHECLVPEAKGVIPAGVLLLAFAAWRCRQTSTT